MSLNTLHCYKTHGPHAMESTKQWTKTPIPITKWGASTHPEEPRHCTVNINLRALLTLLLKIGSIWPKLDQVGPCPIGPQHSHVTSPKSLSYDALNLCCNAIIDGIVLLDYFCYVVFLSVHFFQQCLLVDLVVYYNSSFSLIHSSQSLSYTACEIWRAS